jgi:peptidoglycan/LPS O-acetylase OafA/YrhL
MAASSEHGSATVGVYAPPRWGTKLAGIEGLRALAAMTVLAGHVFYFSRPSRIAPDFGPLTQPLVQFFGSGLTLFFALSGFLLYRQFVTAIIINRDMPSVRTYLHNRALRIVPAYWLILFVIGVVLPAAQLSGSNYDVGRLNVQTFLADAFLVQNYYPRGIGTGIEPAWSLAVEVIFYLVLPVLSLVAWRCARTAAFGMRIRIALIPPMLLLVIGLTCKVIAAQTIDHGATQVGQWGATWHAVFERSFLCSADLFAFGMMAAVATAVQDVRPSARPNRLIAVVASVAIAIWLVATLATTRDHLDVRLYRTVISAVSGVLIYVVATPDSAGWLRRVLEWRPIAWIGIVSYSLYLWHYPMIALLRDHSVMSSRDVLWLGNLVLVIAVAVSLASLSYLRVERPTMARKHLGLGRVSRRERKLRAAELAEAAP